MLVAVVIGLVVASALGLLVAAGVRILWPGLDPGGLSALVPTACGRWGSGGC